LVDNPATFATSGNGIGFAQISREEGRIGRHEYGEL
jgi:hypothetical protein